MTLTMLLNSQDWVFIAGMAAGVLLTSLYELVLASRRRPAWEQMDGWQRWYRLGAQHAQEARTATASLRTQGGAAQGD